MVSFWGVHISGYRDCFCVPVCPSQGCERASISGQMCVWCSREMDTGLMGTHCSVPWFVMGQGIMGWLGNTHFTMVRVRTCDLHRGLDLPSSQGLSVSAPVCLGHFRIPLPCPTPGWALQRMFQVTPPYSLYFSDSSHGRQL